MAISPAFDFGSVPSDLRAGVHLARIPAGLTTTEGLMTALRETLCFPDYFGSNWNALSDCLRDFHWLPPGGIVLVHDDLPAIPESDLFFYLDVLAEAVGSWQPHEEHSLRVVFPVYTRAKVLGVASAVE